MSRLNIRNQPVRLKNIRLGTQDVVFALTLRLLNFVFLFFVKMNKICFFFQSLIEFCTFAQMVNIDYCCLISRSLPYFCEKKEDATIRSNSLIIHTLVSFMQFISLVKQYFLSQFCHARGEYSKIEGYLINTDNNSCLSMFVSHRFY